MTDPDLWTVDELIEALRLSALDTAMIVKATSLETVEGQAAEVLEEWQQTLRLIAEGYPEPQEVARNALRITDGKISP